jgi:hypothetical protein
MSPPQRKPDLLAEELEIEQELRRLGISESGDFTARVNRLSSYVLEEIKANSKVGQSRLEANFLLECDQQFREDEEVSDGRRNKAAH